MRHLRFLGALLVVAGTASLAAFGATATASAQTGVATLSGEALASCHAGTVVSVTVGCGNLADTGHGSFRIRARCTSTGTGRISWTASGPATGPYAGTFTETGVAEFTASQLTSVVVNFHIDSPTADVDGRKFIVAPTGSGGCLDNSNPGFPGFLSYACCDVRYEAIIKPATGGSFGDEGEAFLSVLGVTTDSPLVAENEATIGWVQEEFTSDLLFAEPLLPDAKEQCKDGGFLIVGVFKNQGDCVSFVTTHGKNEPGKNEP